MSNKVYLDAVLYTEIAITSTNEEPYEWGIAAIVSRDSDGQLFYVDAGGCSCNYWGFERCYDLEPVYSIEEGLRKAPDSFVRERLLRSLGQSDEEIPMSGETSE